MTNILKRFPLNTKNEVILITPENIAKHQFPSHIELLKRLDAYGVSLLDFAKGVTHGIRIRNKERHTISNSSEEALFALYHAFQEEAETKFHTKIHLAYVHSPNGQPKEAKCIYTLPLDDVYMRVFTPLGAELENTLGIQRINKNTLF